MEQILVCRKEAAKALSISVDTLDRLSVSGKIYPVRIGAKVLCFTDDLLAFCDGLKKEGRV